MYKCNHCNITFSGKDDEGILTFRGKMYCKKCEEPIMEIPDAPPATGTIHGAQATLISNSDNRIITNNYYGGGTPDEQIDTPYGPCQKSEARFCKQCRQWVPLAYFNQEKYICFDCELKESQESFEEGKNFFEMGFFDDAIQCFKKYESVCPKDDIAEVKAHLGRCYYEQEDYKQALKYFIAASRNNAESIYYIGICHLNGTGVAKDEGKAQELLKRSANMGNQKAIDFLLERQRLEERKKMLETMKLHPIEENGKYGYADENGNVVILCKWKEASWFHEGFAYVQDENYKYGYIDKTGNVVIPCKWKEAFWFHEGLARVKDNNDKYGYIDKTGEMVSPCKWKSADDFQYGLSMVLGDNNKYGLIDKTGKMVTLCKWIAYQFQEGLICVQDENYKYGYIDKIGNVVIPCKWKYADIFNEGLARVRDENYKYGYIDKTGNVVIPCKWKEATGFHKDLARVKDDNDKYVYIDKTGKVIS